jgi:two-component system LytT family sensor kinase
MSSVSHKISIWQLMVKYKLYHIPFWVAYHCMWWAIAVGSISEVTNNLMTFSPYSIKSAFYVTFQALGVYFNLYFLIPKFLETGRYVLYVGLLLLTIICTATMIATGYVASAWLYGESIATLYGSESNLMHFIQDKTLLSTVASFTLAMSVKLAKSWLQTRRREQILQTEKLETELKFLKYQFNPHFLFNTINSIFFLIHKNPDKASASLAKFSDLLRHQLYENNDNLIALNKEIAYLGNFIELEKLRQNSNLTIDVDIDKHHPGHLGIAPFILMTFVENAFKHVSKDDDKSNWINIKLTSTQNQISFMVSNSTSASVTKRAVDIHGIGLPNVQRRLELLYPAGYELNIQDHNDRYEVNLCLPLAKHLISTPLHKAPKNNVVL